MSNESKIKDCKVRIRIAKASITKTLKKVLDEDDNPLTLSFCDQNTGSHFLSTIVDKINVLLATFGDTTTQLLMLHSEGSDSEFESLHGEFCDYELNINHKLAIVKQWLASLKEKEAAASRNVAASRSSDTSSVQNAFNFELPKIKIDPFSSCDEDTFAFVRFSASFNNALSAFPNITGGQKMYWLKSLLRGKALSLIENVPNVESAFSECWKLLEQEFLDKKKIIDLTIKEIVEYKKLSTTEDLNKFFVFLKFKLIELAKQNVNFVNETSGNIILSYIVREKCPKYFLMELCRSIQSPYPSLQAFLNESSDIIKMLSMKTNNNETSSKNVKPDKTTNQPSSSNASYANKTNCKLCLLANHSTLHCKKYVTHEDRKKQAERNSLCARCLSKAHNESDCPGVKFGLKFQCGTCHKNDHVTPMCPKLESGKPM